MFHKLLPIGDVEMQQDAVVVVYHHPYTDPRAS